VPIAVFLSSILGRLELRKDYKRYVNLCLSVSDCYSSTVLGVVFDTPAVWGVWHRCATVSHTGCYTSRCAPICVNVMRAASLSLSSLGRSIRLSYTISWPQTLAIRYCGRQCREPVLCASRPALRSRSYLV